MVPEKLNLICDLVGGNGGSIKVEGKLEGDVQLTTRNGNISVTKLRGHVIDLKAAAGGGDGGTTTIYARDLLEAEKLSVTATDGARIRAKQVLGRRIQLSVRGSTKQEESLCSTESPASTSEPTVVEMDEDDEGSLVDVGAMFVSGDAGATIDVEGPFTAQLARRAVRVKSNHGPLEVLVDGCCMPTEESPITGDKYPLVELGGVNGNCEVSIRNSVEAAAHGDEKADFDDWTSCQVHFDSLSPSSVSLITVDRGDTAITMDRKVECDVRLLSSSSDDCLTETGALLAEEEDNNLLLSVVRNLPKGRQIFQRGGRRISVDTASFTPRQSDAALADMDASDVEYVDGWVENRSEEPDSRFDQRFRRADTGVGKIRLDSAADQALKGFGKDSDEYVDGGDGNKGETRANGEPRPLVAVVSTGRIMLETVSWIGAIARRYGLDEESTRRRGAGRTASRKGRPIVPQE